MMFLVSAPSRWIARTLSAGACLASILLGEGARGLLIGVSLLIMGELIAAFGPLAFIYGVAFIGFPPGLLARNGAWFAVAGIVLIFLPLLIPRERGEVTKRTWLLAAGPILAALSLVASGTTRLELIAIVLLLVLPIVAIASRPEFARRAIGVVSWLVVAQALSYLLSIILGAFGRTTPQLVEFEYPYRWYLYFPFTPTVGGTKILGPESEFPRLVIFTHEPGLSVFYLALALGFFFTQRGATRVIGLVLKFVALICTQSFGAYLSLAVGLAAVGLIKLWLSGYRGTATIGCVAGLPVLLFLGNHAVEFRVAASANTVYDRGLGGASTLAVGNVNLLVGVSSYPAETAILIVGLLGAIAFVSFNPTTPGIFFVASALCTATFNEPLAWQFGFWIMLMAVVAADSSTTDSGTNSSRFIASRSSLTSTVFRPL